MVELRCRYRIAAARDLLLLLFVFLMGFGAERVYADSAVVKELSYAEIAAPIYLAVDRGSDMDAIEALLQEAEQKNEYAAWYCPEAGTGEEEVKLECDVLWDITAIKPESNGVYTIQGTLDIGDEHYVIPEDPSKFHYYGGLPTAHIIISEPQCMDLSNGILNETNTLVCRWSWRIPELAKARVEYAVGDGSWQMLQQGDTEGVMISYKTEIEKYITTICYLQDNELQIELSEIARIDTDITHHFRISYDGSYSDTLHIEMPADWEDDPGTLEITWDGDRDMVDRSGDELGALEQTVPVSADTKVQEKDADVSQQSARYRDSELLQDKKSSTQTVTERVSEVQTTISGARLQTLIQHSSGSVMFEKQGISLYLPAEFLSDLSLQNDDELMVMIRREEKGFFISISVKGEPVSAIPKSLLRIAADDLQEGVKYSLICKEDGAVSEAETDYKNDILSAYIVNTGYYEIIEEADMRKNEKESHSAFRIDRIFGIVLIVVCLAGGIVFLCRRRRNYDE